MTDHRPEWRRRIEPPPPLPSAPQIEGGHPLQVGGGRSLVDSIRGGSIRGGRSLVDSIRNYSKTVRKALHAGGGDEEDDNDDDTCAICFDELGGEAGQDGGLQVRSLIV